MTPIVDFHSHILPGVDDGSRDVYESIEMLELSRRQGVTDICLTPHFNAFYDSPQNFLSRRNEAYKRLLDAIRDDKLPFPRMYLGAEVAYFNGISEAKELCSLSIGRSNCLLVEMPMSKWSDYSLDEVEAISSSIGSIPVLAHVDRYIEADFDRALMDRLSSRKLLLQFNAAFLVARENRRVTDFLLRSDKVHFIGSDCHRIDWRRPNISDVDRSLAERGYQGTFRFINERACNLLSNRF